MNLLRHLRAAWNYARYMPYTELPDGFEWTDEDRAAYTDFMHSTPAGQKLRIMALHRLNQIALNATQAQHTLPYQCGFASGVRATFYWQDSLLKLSPASAHEASEQSETAGTDMLANYAA